VFGNHFRWSEENYTVTAKILAADSLVSDANEPNDTYEEAKKLDVGKTVKGVIEGQADEDWFEVRLTGKAYKMSLMGLTWLLQWRIRIISVNMMKMTI